MRAATKTTTTITPTATAANKKATPGINTKRIFNGVYANVARKRKTTKKCMRFLCAPSTKRKQQHSNKLLDVFRVEYIEGSIFRGSA